jgi:hypothetical protein
VPRLLWTPLYPPWEVVTFHDLAERPSVDFVIDVSAFRDRRAAALRAHRTQHLSIDRCFFNRLDVDRELAVEIWRQAWGPSLHERPARDILQGL